MSRWFSKFWASSNGYNEIEFWFSSTEEMWMGEMIDSSSEIMGIKTSSRMLFSLAHYRSRYWFKDWTRIAKLKLRFTFIFQVQFQKIDNLPKYQGFDFGQVQVGMMMKLKLDFQTDMILKSYKNLVGIWSQPYFELVARTLARIP